MPVLSVPVAERGSCAIRVLLRFAVLTLLLFGVAGCGAGLATQQAQVRVVHASLRAGSLDVSSSSASGLGSAAIAYDLSFGTVTSYMPVAPSASTMLATAAGSHTEIASAHLDGAKSRQSTLLIEDTPGGVVSQVLADGNQPAPAGHALLRFVNASEDGTLLDLYLVPVERTNSRTVAVATGFSPGMNSGYISIPAGTYTLYVMSSGMALRTAQPLYIGAAMTYPNGAARTVVLLIPSSSDTHAMQVIALNDFDPSTVAQ